MLRRNSCIPTLLSVLLLASLALTSQRSQAVSAPYLDTNRLEWVAPTVIAEGRVRVIITKAKAKLYLPKTQRPLARIFLNDDNDDYYNVTPEFQVGYRRPELINQTADINDDLSDEIKLRLILARKRALEAYNRKWS